jgi:VWFA-related protein
MNMRGAGFVVAVLMAGSVPLAAQVPGGEAQPPPVFGVGVDVVAVDASVVDADGRPVLGLGPDDFRVQVDGKPRHIVTVEYVGRDLEAPSAPAARPVHYSTNEDAPRGRLVLLMVDRGSIGRGGGRQVMRAGERFLDTLAPADRVGLTFIPGPGTFIEFTSDVDAVRQGLKGVVGMADRAGHAVPLAEAVAHIKNRDNLRWQQFLDANCDFRMESQNVACRQEMEAEAGQVYLAYRERSLQTQRSLSSVLKRLKSVEGPKTLILISEGLGTESPAEARDLAADAAAAQVTLFVLLLDTSGPDAQYKYTELATPEDRERETSGLYDLAGLSRGVVLQVVGSGDNAFQRIARELMGYYMLGIEPEGGDRDGRSHSVKVEVSRPKATVRARGLLNIPTTPPSHQELLTATLRSPLVERGLPVRASAYALRGATPGKVRLLITARVGRATRPVSVGFVLAGPQGKVAASRGYEGVAGGDGEWVEFTGEAEVDPATYTLRLAAVDAGARRGSVEHTVKAALVSAGGLEISDLVLAPSSAGGGVRPAVDLELEGGGLSALLEVAGRDPARVAEATVALELADSADGPSLLRAPVTTGAADKDGTRTARIEIAAGLLPPGDYAARAEVSLEGKPVAVVTRPFRIAPPRAGTAIPRAPLAGLLVETRPFDRAELLKPDTLGHFLDRLGALVPGSVPPRVAAAVEEARQGRPEAMVDRLGEGGKDDARTAFLRGVSYYARGNMPAALTQLQAALRLDSELFPAAVYMGGCYAADGKDLDAIGAWQTALIGEVDSPVLYALLGDALVRAKEGEQALAILSEGLAVFPDDAGLRRRLGMAYAMAGRAEEALPLLTAWVDTHPEDQQALFATLALLFEGFSRETAGAAAAEERQRLTRYAKAYVDGKGPNREVIERWLRYLESRKGG